MFVWLFDNEAEWRQYIGTDTFFEKGMVGTSPYHCYLRSRQWQSTRKRKLREAGYRCERCGALHQKGVMMQVHHRTYRRVTQERMEDLEALCRDCHRKHHGVEVA